MKLLSIVFTLAQVEGLVEDAEGKKKAVLTDSLGIFISPQTPLSNFLESLL